MGWVVFFFLGGGGGWGWGTRYPTSIYIEGTIIFLMNYFPMNKEWLKREFPIDFGAKYPLAFFLASFNAFLFTGHEVPTYPK